MKSKALVAIAALLYLSACSSDNPGLTSRPKIEEPIHRPTAVQTGERTVAEYDPRVDILFVIDNSQSMEKHQTNLANNIPKFVAEFAKIKSIDFHVGVTTVWDSSRYESVDGKKPIVPAMCGDGRVNWLPEGTLVPLIGADKKPIPGKTFVSRADKDFTSILANSLSPKENPMLFKAYTQLNDPKVTCHSGPEKEEVFSPMLAALTQDIPENKGFRREGAFLVIIIVSDAKSEDVPDRYTPETVAEELSRITGEAKLNKKRYRVFSVVYKSGTKISESCKPDPAFDEIGKTRPDGVTPTIPRWGAVIQKDENPLETLAALTTGDSQEDHVLSICSSNYGEQLGKYGAQVKQDALADLVLKLPSDPQIFEDPDDSRRLRVFLGDKVELKEGEHWTYQGGKRNQVVIKGQNVPWDSAPNEKVRVVYIPVDLGSDTTKVHGAE